MSGFKKENIKRTIYDIGKQTENGLTHNFGFKNGTECKFLGPFGNVKGGVEQGFLNVFLFYEKYLIDKYDLERYLSITLMIIMRIFEKKIKFILIIKGGVEQGFLNVFFL